MTMQTFWLAEPTQIVFGIACILVAARVLGMLATRLKQPAIVGEIVAGVLLGPTVFGRIFPAEASHMTFSDASAASTFGFITNLAALMLLFFAGLEMDLSRLWENRRAALFVSIGGFVAPFCCGAVAAWMLPILQLEGYSLSVSLLFWGSAMAISALPVIARIFSDLKLLHTRVAGVTLVAAAINDIAGWLVFSGLLMWTRPESNESAIEGLGISSLLVALALGAILTLSRRWAESLRNALRGLVTAVFAPILFASAGLRVDLASHFDVTLVIVICLVATAGKLLGCTGAARLAGIRDREAWNIGFAMNARGAMGIMLALAALEHGLIGESLFVALTTMALFTTITAAPLLSFQIKGAPVQDSPLLW